MQAFNEAIASTAHPRFIAIKARRRHTMHDVRFLSRCGYVWDAATDLVLSRAFALCSTLFGADAKIVAKSAITQVTGLPNREMQDSLSHSLMR